MSNFAEFFQKATAHAPYAYQCRLAFGKDANPDKPETVTTGRDCGSLLINIPTGLGKTAAVVLAWLWNRLLPTLNPQPSTIEPIAWPRRVVYYLPMRTLVEQTQTKIHKWLQNLLNKTAEFAPCKWAELSTVPRGLPALSPCATARDFRLLERTILQESERTLA